MAVSNDKSVPDVKAVMGTYVVSTDIGADESGPGPAGVRWAGRRLVPPWVWIRERRSGSGWEFTSRPGMGGGLNFRSGATEPWLRKIRKPGGRECPRHG